MSKSIAEKTNDLEDNIDLRSFHSAHGEFLVFDITICKKHYSGSNFPWSPHVLTVLLP